MKRLLPLRSLALLVAFASLGAMPLTAQEADRFNHETHDRLFPLCSGCHSAMAADAGTELYPTAQVCARCHDGQQVRRVQWTGPQRTPSNLSYDHVSHATAVGGRSGESAETRCASCHRVPDGRGVEAVRRPAPETCLTCHEHEAPEHLSPGRDCAVCHLTLTAAQDLAPAQIQEFPQPPTHGEPDFLGTHRPVEASDLVSCQTCHARESCTRCHLNGAELSDIQRLEPDPRVAALLLNKAPEYPVPGSHDPGDWSWAHGGGATATGAGCGNCHVQASCQACHRDGSLAAIAVLPRIERDDPRGVLLSDPIRWVHPPQFELHHNVSAAVEVESCAGCHAQSYCENCHDAADQPVFHFGNVLQTHATEAWGNQVECTACHNPELFCRACHQNLGLASESNLDVAYHTSRPTWLLGHGAAARQALESCRSCHSQQDCTRCHSSVNGWNINPHGPGFDPERAQKANPGSCLPCHGLGGSG